MTNNLECSIFASILFTVLHHMFRIEDIFWPCILAKVVSIGEEGIFLSKLA